MNPPSQLLEGRRVWLDTQLTDHRDFLYQLMTDPDSAASVRFHGAILSPRDVEAALWDDVLAQFVVRGRETSRAMGLVVLSTPSFIDRYCFFSMVAAPEAMKRGFVVEGAILTIEYAFTMWDFRKIYLDVLVDSLGHFGRSLQRYAQPEGCLRAHSYRAGRYCDLHKFAIYADKWQLEARHLVKAASREHDQVPTF